MSVKDGGWPSTYEMQHGFGDAKPAAFHDKAAKANAENQLKSQRYVNRRHEPWKQFISRSGEIMPRIGDGIFGAIGDWRDNGRR
jgi:hypothetical protein